MCRNEKDYNDRIRMTHGGEFAGMRCCHPSSTGPARHPVARHVRAVVVALVGALATVAGCGTQEPPAPPTANIPAPKVGARPQNQQIRPAGPATTAMDRDRLLHPTVEIETSLGRITVRLDAEHAPGSVSNFLEYVNARHYDQTIFHYVQPGTLILGGGFTANQKPKPTGAPIRNEAHNGLKNKRGTVAMSRDYDSIDSATCQFFINLADNPALDHRQRTAEEYGYCVFGRVIAGMDVAERIGAVPTHDQGQFVSTPVKPVVIKSVRLLP